MDYQPGDFFFPEHVNELLFAGFVFNLLQVGYQYRHIYPVKHLPGRSYALFAEASHIVKARSVDDDHRPQGKQFHGFAHGIRRGAFLFGNHRQILPRDGIYQAGFACIPPSEKAYFNTFTRRYII